MKNRNINRKKTEYKRMRQKRKKRCCHKNQDAATPLRMVTTTTGTSGYPVVIFSV